MSARYPGKMCKKLGIAFYIHCISLVCDLIRCILQMRGFIEWKLVSASSRATQGCSGRGHLVQHAHTLSHTHTHQFPQPGLTIKGQYP